MKGGSALYKRAVKTRTESALLMGSWPDHAACVVDMWEALLMASTLHSDLRRQLAASGVVETIIVSMLQFDAPINVEVSTCRSCGIAVIACLLVLTCFFLFCMYQDRVPTPEFKPYQHRAALRFQAVYMLWMLCGQLGWDSRRSGGGMLSVGAGAGAAATGAGAGVGLSAGLQSDVQSLLASTQLRQAVRRGIGAAVAAQQAAALSSAQGAGAGAGAASVRFVDGGAMGGSASRMAASLLQQSGRDALAAELLREVVRFGLVAVERTHLATYDTLELQVRVGSTRRNAPPLLILTFPHCPFLFSGERGTRVPSFGTGQ